MTGRGIRAALRQLGYTLSLPERAVRSLVALTAGATKLATDVIVPAPLRTSRTYAAIVGNAQRFLIEKVGEVKGAYEGQGTGLPDDYVPRKVAGNVLEAAGIFSMHLSPLWLFAVAADVSDGSRKYLKRLTEELRRDGVISEDAEVRRVDDLLAAMGRASENSARVFDTPPLSRDQIDQLREQLIGGYGEVFRRMGNIMPRIDALWEQMQTVTDTDKALSRVAGLMTLDLGKVGGQALGGLWTVGRTTGELVGETILASYAESLGRLRERGLTACVEEATRPYVAALAGHYCRSRITWTERLLGWIMRLFGWKNGAERNEESPPGEVRRPGE